MAAPRKYPVELRERAVRLWRSTRSGDHRRARGAAAAAQAGGGAGTRQRDPQGGERLFRGRARPDPATVMSFVAEHRDLFGVEPILRVLDIPTSTFYGWVAQQRDP